MTATKVPGGQTLDEAVAIPRRVAHMPVHLRLGPRRPRGGQHRASANGMEVVWVEAGQTAASPLAALAPAA